MKSEDKIIKALNVLAGMCDADKPQVNKFIAADMVMSLRNNFQTIQNTLDAQSNHTVELLNQIDGMQTALLAKDEVIKAAKVLLFHKDEDLDRSKSWSNLSVALNSEALQNQNTREESKHNWPDDFRYENGNYENMCDHCGTRFIGNKRRVNCRVCDSTQAQQK